MIWDMPRGTRTQSRGRRRRRSSARSDAKKEIAKRLVHFRRTKAQLRLVTRGQSISAIYPARVILNDFSQNGVRLFVTVPFEQGQSVNLTIENPRNFYVKGTVRWCRLIPSESLIMAEMHYCYRLEIEFSFANAEERQAVKKYCEQIFSEYLASDHIPIV